MKPLYDIVNFNPDASCFPSHDWMQALVGGVESKFYQWLELYVRFEKKMILGITGAAVADLKKFNPEAIKIINQHPDIFEIVLRPFSHDIALLRSRRGFELNVLWGAKCLKQEFNQISNLYLPPEFMLTAEQIEILAKMNFKGTFINPARMSDSTAAEIPKGPYKVRGVFGSELPCIPVAGFLVKFYLESIQKYEVNFWNEALKKETGDVFFWRDGESPFLIPDGIHRERYWLEHESKEIERQHLNSIPSHTLDSIAALPHLYPLHPFSAWLREFRLMGFLRRMFSLENRVGQMKSEELALWMYIINSDVLSSVEKKSPRVQLKVLPADTTFQDFIIRRSDRHLEGEEYMVLLEDFNPAQLAKYLNQKNVPQVLKLKARLEYLSSNLL